MVLNVHASDLGFYLSQFSTKSVIKISNDIYTIVIEDTLIDSKPASPKGIPKQDEKTKTVKLHNFFQNDTVKNNVAIAAAITAYARIYMMPFKLDPSCAYSDTDSLFTKDELNLLKHLLYDQ